MQSCYRQDPYLTDCRRATEFREGPACESELLRIDILELDEIQKNSREMCRRVRIRAGWQEWPRIRRGQRGNTLIEGPAELRMNLTKVSEQCKYLSLNGVIPKQSSLREHAGQRTVVIS